MKKSLLALSLASLGVLAAGSAMAQSHGDKSGWFINGNVGQSAIDKGPYDSHDTGYAINGGYRWALNPQVALGVEAGYNDLGNIKVRNAFTSDPVLAKQRSELHGWTAGVNGHFNLASPWYVSARTGVYGWRGHGLSNDDIPLRRNVDKTDWYGGVGVGYDFASNWSLGVNYDYFHAKKDHVDLSSDLISFGAEYRF